MGYAAVELFAGLGGWSTALRALGGACIGLEIAPTRRASRRANGLHTVQGDVRDYRPGQFPGIPGLIGSPPCQPFSRAGLGDGRRSLGSLLRALDQESTEWSDLDPRSALVLEPWRWLQEASRDGHPYQWVALEQVPSVLPIWQAMARRLRGLGYSVVTGKVYAEQYGVPQTRVRAVLLARLGTPVAFPRPTHSRYYARTRGKLDDGVLPWVSMAEALGWTHDPPEAWPDERVRNPSGVPFDPSFPWLQPSPAITARPLVTFPGANANRRNGSAKSRNDGLRVSLAEALVLQGFPRGFTVMGKRTDQFHQVGDAVPPALGEALLAQVFPTPRREHRPVLAVQHGSRGSLVAV